MTAPCESKQDIHDLIKEQTRQGKDLAVVKDATDRLRMDQASFISESREVIGLLREMAIEGKLQQKQSKEVQDVLFQKVRENRADIKVLAEKVGDIKSQRTDEIAKALKPVKDDVQSIKDKHTAEDGKSLLLKDIRVTLSMGSALIATIALLWDRLVGWIR